MNNRESKQVARLTRGGWTTILLFDWDTDLGDETADMYTMVVEPTIRGVELSFDGFGSCSIKDGQGSPVYVEYRQGVPHLLIWADINSEEPTHVISLEGARESLRKPDNLPPEG